MPRGVYLRTPKPRKPRPERVCSTALCGKLTRGGSEFCEACYCYLWRTGRARDPRKKPYKLKSLRRCTGSNYRMLRVPGHPLANAVGDVYHHRLMAYAARDGVCGACHWCGVHLEWKSAVVDHLNEDKSDNQPSNLVVACNRCNRARGSMLPFFRALRPERFDEVMSLMLVHVRSAEGAA